MKKGKYYRWIIFAWIKDKVTISNILKLTSIIMPILVCIIYLYGQFQNTKIINEVLTLIKENENNTEYELRNQFVNAIAGTYPNMISTGIAIIAVAVAVWIGLNIYNLSSKQDMDTIISRISELEKKQNIQEQRYLALGLKEHYRRENIYQKIIQTEPDNWLNYNILGTEYYRNKRKDEAEFMFGMAAEIAHKNNIRYCNAYYNQALMLEENKELESALEEFKKLDKIENKDYEIKLHIEEIYLKLAKTAKNDTRDLYLNNAKKILERLSNDHNKNCYVYVDYGIYYILKEQYDKAVNSLKTALEFQDDLDYAHYYLMNLKKAGISINRQINEKAIEGFTDDFELDFSNIKRNK